MLAGSARTGHSKTLEALSQVGHTLGIAAASVVNLLNPQALLLGGFFAPLTEWLREPIEAELHRRLLAEKIQHPDQMHGRRVRCDGGGTGLLAEFPAVRIDRDRQMHVGRSGQTQQTLQQDLARCRLEDIETAHHLADALIGIVHHAA